MADDDAPNFFQNYQSQPAPYLYRRTLPLPPSSYCPLFFVSKKRPAVTSYTTHQKRPYIPRLSHPFLTGDFRLSCNLTAIHVTAKVFFSIFYISLRDLGTLQVDNA